MNLLSIGARLECHVLAAVVGSEQRGRNGRFGDSCVSPKPAVGIAIRDAEQGQRGLHPASPVLHDARGLRFKRTDSRGVTALARLCRCCELFRVDRRVGHQSVGFIRVLGKPLRRAHTRVARRAFYRGWLLGWPRVETCNCPPAWWKA